MNTFKQLNIKPKIVNAFVGEKISINKILDREIIVHHYNVVPSKFPKDNSYDRCMHLQIELKGTKHVVFTSSLYLLDQIEQAKSSLPFTTTIVEENKRLLFT